MKEHRIHRPNGEGMLPVCLDCLQSESFALSNNTDCNETTKRFWNKPYVFDGVLTLSNWTIEDEVEYQRKLKTVGDRDKKFLEEFKEISEKGYNKSRRYEFFQSF